MIPAVQNNSLNNSAVFNGGAGGSRAPPEFGGSGKGRSLISAFWSLAITTNTPGFTKLNMALLSSCLEVRSHAWYVYEGDELHRKTSKDSQMFFMSN